MWSPLSTSASSVQPQWMACLFISKYLPLRLSSPSYSRPAVISDTHAGVISYDLTFLHVEIIGQLIEQRGFYVKILNVRLIVDGEKVMPKR